MEAESSLALPSQVSLPTRRFGRIAGVAALI